MKVPHPLAACLMLASVLAHEELVCAQTSRRSKGVDFISSPAAGNYPGYRDLQ
jgi:hypothetical protein